MTRMDTGTQSVERRGLIAAVVVLLAAVGASLTLVTVQLKLLGADPEPAAVTI